MFKKLFAAIGLLVANFWLFSAIMLTVWLPASLFVESIASSAITTGHEWGYFAIHSVVAAIFGPLPIAALLFAVAEIHCGRAVTYGEAMRAGWRLWGKLFVARFVVGLLTVGGLLLLVIPGIVIAVRYFFVDCVVVLENADSTRARARSVSLTRGRRWELFGFMALFFVAFGVLLVGFGCVIGGFRLANSFVACVIADCIGSVVVEILSIGAFLYYWEAAEPEAAASMASSPHSGAAAGDAGALHAPAPLAGYLRCPNPACAAVNPAVARYCARCGGPLPDEGPPHA
jgi:hypothetical protein